MCLIIMASDLTFDLMHGILKINVICKNYGWNPRYTKSFENCQNCAILAQKMDFGNKTLNFNGWICFEMALWCWFTFLWISRVMVRFEKFKNDILLGEGSTHYYSLKCPVHRHLRAQSTERFNLLQTSHFTIFFVFYWLIAV